MVPGSGVRIPHPQPGRKYLNIAFLSQRLGFFVAGVDCFTGEDTVDRFYEVATAQFTLFKCSFYPGVD